MQETPYDVIQPEMPRRIRIYRVEGAQRDAAITMLKALASEQRLRILEYLADKVANVSEISQALDIPLSTTTLHLNALEEAGLIQSEMVAATRGLQKLCARIFDGVVIHLPTSRQVEADQIRIDMPVGAFADCEVSPTCGLASETQVLGPLDDPAAFYAPERFQAQIIWLRRGYLDYKFPNWIKPGGQVQSLSISMEICSEAPLHHPEWPSDIFLEINGVEIGQWTSPGDFGGERGILTPTWWDIEGSQYGLLKKWRVDQSGAWIDGVHLSSVTVADLALDSRPFIGVRFGVHADAANVGGLNVFGRKFGNHPQDIVLQIRI